MAAAWDRRSESALASLQNTLLKRQVRDSVAPFSPLWRRRFAELGRTADSVRTVADLARLPAMGERDVSPSGDPVAMSTLVLQAGETDYVLHADGPDVRRALRLRLRSRDAYRRVVDADTRATSFVFAGLGFRYPIASTRHDLDVIARAGARLWAVLGLTRDDVLLSAVPPGPSTEHVALQYAAMAAGAPALFPGEDSAALALAVRLTPPSVLALPAASAAALLGELSGLGSVRTLLLVGAPTNEERVAAAHGLFRAGGPTRSAILAVHAPQGARVLWGECAESGGTSGLHTYPDLEIVQVVDPATVDASRDGGELVLTQLGMRGSALLRWRTGDAVDEVTAGPCPSCGRTVPRVLGLRRGALVIRLETGRLLDLRSIASVMQGRADVEDWRLVVSRRGRDGTLAVTVHLAAVDREDPSTVIGVASDIRTVTSTLPTQLVAASHRDLAAISGSSMSDRIPLGH